MTTPKPKRNWTKTKIRHGGLLWGLLLGLVLGVLGFWLVSPPPSSQDTRPPSHAETRADVPGETALAGSLPDNAETWLVRRETVPVTIQALGTVRSVREIRISSRLQARVEEIPVHAGEHASKCRLLVRLDDRDLRAQLAQAGHEHEALDAALDQARRAVESAQAGLDFAEAEHQRINALHTQGATARHELDRIKANLLQSRAALEQARQGVRELVQRRAGLEQRLREIEVNLDHARITAPEDAVVAELLAEPGDMAQPGQPLLTLHTARQLRLEAALPERLRSRVALGDSLLVRIDAMDLEIHGVVDEIEPVADAVSRNFVCKLTLPSVSGAEQGAIHPGAFGRLFIPLGQEEIVRLPTDAVLRAGQLELAVVVRDGVPVLRHLRLGRISDGFAQVLSGLQGGETVWLHPHLQP
jgi:HlyD family secretion protein